MDPRFTVRDITVDRPHATVSIIFGDGFEGQLGFVELRENCPCATCRGARDQGLRAWPTGQTRELTTGQTSELTVTDARLVGAWGLGLTWHDGHATGIYPWESLRQWCEQGRPAFGADSGRGA
jgi:DUF971 family protein